MFKTTRLIGNLIDGNLSLFNLPTSLLCHYLQLALTVAQFVSSLIQLLQKNVSCLSPEWWLLTSRASQWQFRDNQGFSFFPLIWPQHIAYLSLPSLSTWLNIVTALMNYVSPSESHSFILVSFTPSSFQMCICQLQGHLKANDFNKTIKKGNRFYFSFPCVPVITRFSGFSMLLDKIDIKRNTPVKTYVS